MNYFITSLSTGFSLHFAVTKQFNLCFSPAEPLMPVHFGSPCV